MLQNKASNYNFKYNFVKTERHVIHDVWNLMEISQTFHWKIVGF
jgi:hypothetical protein